MKKIRPSFSNTFYKRTLINSIIIISLLSLLMFSISAFVITRDNLASSQKKVVTKNEICSSQIITAIENCSGICMFFASYQKSLPVFQFVSDTESQKTILRKEAITFLSCFDYIASINIFTPDYNVGVGDTITGDFTSSTIYGSFEISYSKAAGWPQLIKIDYLSHTANFFSTSIYIDTKYLSKQYLEEDTYCVTKTGSILMSSDTNLIGKNIKSIAKPKTSIIDESTEFSSYISSSNTLVKDELYIVSLEKSLSAFSIASPSFLLLSLLYLFVLSVSVLLICIVVKRIYHPIEEVVQAFKYYFPNDKTFAEDDVKFISKCIGEGSVDETTRSTVLQIRKSQLHALHSQISPHFLGNSLDALKWKSVKYLGIHNDISSSIAILSYFLKDLQQYGKMITTISEEKLRIEKYIQYITLCFEISIKVNWNIDESLLDCSIISLTLQSLIENSVFRGFERQQNAANAQIDIEILPIQNDIHIRIKDNGCGMKPETLSAIKKVLSDDEPCEHHIGLKNTHLKLKLLYGKNYGIIEIISDSNGTSIDLLIPKIIYPLDT